MDNIHGDEFDFLIGKSIVKYEYINDAEIFYTSDGQKITVKCNEGCSGCSSGWSSIDLDELAKQENYITNVECKYDDNDSDTFSLFIIYEDKKLEIRGDDGVGNGNYGAGFWIEIEDINNNQ